jgi:hypothetical protein
MCYERNVVTLMPFISIFHQISAAGKFPKARWLLFVNESTSLEKLFANIYIPFDCEFLVAQWSVTSLELSLTELYRVFYNRPLQTFRVANWTSRGGFSWSSVPFFSRRNLQGITIKGAAIPYVRISFVSVFQYDKSWWNVNTKQSRL